jgi:hypothetical protein
VAPRAGFEVERKFLSAHIDGALHELNTPSDTPRKASLEFGGDSFSSGIRMHGKQNRVQVTSLQ